MIERPSSSFGQQNVDQETAALRRGLFLSFLFGMGLTEERLECDNLRVHFVGLERQFLILRWQKVEKKIKLRDVLGIHESYSSFPILRIFAAIAAMNAIAVAAELYWWWDLQIWRLPTLWAPLYYINFISGNSDMIYMYIVVAVVWIGLWFLLRRRYIVVDVSESSKIVMRTNGLGREQVDTFVSILLRRWDRLKTDPGPEPRVPEWQV